jgi:hypothetical protein
MRIAQDMCQCYGHIALGISSKSEVYRAIFAGRNQSQEIESVMNMFAANTTKEVNLMVKGNQPPAIHTTLPIEDLIEIVELEIRELVQYDSFEFTSAQNDSQLMYGVTQQHKCKYRINVGGKLFGRIALSRKTPFAEPEVSLIESALGALIIHLNNAAEYQANLGEAEISQLKLDMAFVNASQS